MQTREEDVVRHLFIANTHAYILLDLHRPRQVLLAARVYDVPEVSRSSEGQVDSRTSVGHMG